MTKSSRAKPLEVYPSSPRQPNQILDGLKINDKAKRTSLFIQSARKEETKLLAQSVDVF